MVDKSYDLLSLQEQFDLLGLNKSTYYYQPQFNNNDFSIIKKIDKIYIKYPFYGSRKITAELKNDDEIINRKRVQRLMRIMGIEAIYQKPKLSQGNKEHRIYPYLLRNLIINKPNQVWCTDITYIPMGMGHLYLIAVMDWYSRYVLSWELSNSLDSSFCVSALEVALGNNNYQKPEIFNTDQGSQFTSNVFTQILLNNNVKISMDSKGRYLDNIFVERLWRSLKYEEVYIKAYNTVAYAQSSINKYLTFYNNSRLHQALDYKTPLQVYTGM